MPLILLAEDEAPTIDQVRTVLASQGWLVKTVDSRDQALRAASEFAPQLVLVNDRLAGVKDLVRTFSRRSGGPGIVLLSAEANGVDSHQHDAQDIEAVLKKPLQTEDLITTIRDRLAEGKEQKTNFPVGGANKILTSEEIFGDLLDDILDPDQDVTEPESEAAPEPAKQEDQPVVEAALPEQSIEPDEEVEIEAALPELSIEPDEEVEIEAALPEQSIEPDEEIEIETALPELSVEPDEEVEVEAALPELSIELDEEVEVEATVDETVPVEMAQAGSEDELADLEDMVREEVGAWAESVDSAEEAPGEIQAVSDDEVGVTEIDEPEPEVEVQPEDLNLQPVYDPFHQEEEQEAEAVAASATVDAEIDLVEDFSEALVDEAEEASDVFEPALDGDGLEDTLAGVLADSLSEATALEANSTDADDVSVDALLSSALGGLNLSGSTTKSTIKKKTSSASTEVAETPAEDSVDSDSKASEQEAAEVESDAVEPPDTEGEAKSQTVGQELSRKLGLVDEHLDENQTVGQEFGDYTLEKRIGLGGMAEVWKARQKGVEGFQKRVAIKKILPQTAENEAFVEMFIDEAKLAAQLNHNNIIHIYDLGRIGEDYYIAMEYVDGKNLRQILTAGRKKDQPIPEFIALHVAARLADALDYAHRSKDFNDADLGLVHRDVSPQNVLISRDGDIKLCDFGIAKAVSKISTTQMGALKGKLQYMSPEQAWGKSIDHRSDIFSLGALLFEMLTDERLFAGESEISVLETVRECDVAGKIIQSSKISAGVKGLLLRALAREPEGRFDSASELQAGLEEILNESSTTPTQKEVAVYMRTLLGEPIETASEETTDSDETSAPELEASPAEVADAEWVGQPAGFEDSAVTEADQRKQAWLKKLLTRLLPMVVLLAGLGGVLAVAWTRQDPPPPAPSASAARAPTVESDSSVQPADLPQSEPTAVESQPTEIEIAQTEATSAPAAPADTETPSLDTPTPEAAPPTGDDTTPKSETSADTADNPTTLTQTPSTQAIDPELERRVEEDLQRVQELISSGSFEGDQSSAPDELSSAPESNGSGQGAADTAEVTVPADSEPQLISFTRPTYTPFADGDPAKGTVNVSLLVDEAGQVIESRIVDGLPQYLDLDNSVLEAARRATFEPAVRDGEPVPMWYELSVRY
jgi:TonB family protein